MTTIPLSMTHRRFAGASASAPGHSDGLAALMDLLIAPTPAAKAAAAPIAQDPAPSAPETAPVAMSDAVPQRPLDADVPRGLYAMSLPGIDPSQRRQVAMVVAERLLPPAGTAVLFLFEEGWTDIHYLGEPACGRLGPHSFLQADGGWTLSDLLKRCDQVAVVSLHGDGSAARRLAATVGRTVLVSGVDAECAVETYRQLKSWRDLGMDGRAALFAVGDRVDEADRFQGRLSEATRRFLGCELKCQGFLARDEATASRVAPSPLVAKAPAREVWLRLEGAQVTPEPLPVAQSPPHVVAAPPAIEVGATPPSQAVEPPTTDAPPRIFSPWQPENAAALIAAVEAQVPAILSGNFKNVFRVEVEEPDAPPLAAVRADGGLVAIVVRGPGESADPSAAARWLKVHRRLLARAFPCSGMDEGAELSVVVLAPLEAPPATDGVRRFLPVRLGGHRGIVLLP